MRKSGLEASFIAIDLVFGRVTAAFTKAVTRSGIDHHKAERYESGRRAHSSHRASNKPSRVVGGYGRARRRASSMTHRFSMAFISGLCGAQSRRSTPCSAMYSPTLRAR